VRIPLPRGIKNHLKIWRTRAVNVWTRRFHAFTPDDLLSAVRRLGVQPGDVVCVHSSFDQFLGFTGHLGDALKVLQRAVGDEGGLMMPTQPFSGSAIDYVREGKPTNIARTPSKMGMITELLRRTKGAVRTIHPTHPVALWGTRGVAMVGRDWESTTPCGKGTAYARLLDEGGSILMLGTGPQPMTFYHYVEELIEPLMPVSPFTVEVFDATSVDAAGQKYLTRMRLLEPVLSGRRSMAIMTPELKRRGFWQEARVGRLQLILLRAADVAEVVRSLAERGTYCYAGMTK
jgi:aminoglycoside 3-N-acetyltransferase